MLEHTTICALATARLNCAIHIIRISGLQSFSIVNKILNKPLPQIGYRIFHRQVVSNNEIVDDVLVNTFVSPKSYTGEDVIEINCHGGVLISDRIIQLLVKHGCVLANRGEFTKRALFNKKIDLSQSQAINNLIHSQNSIAMKGSINSLIGLPSKLIQSTRDLLFDLIGKIEVNIDYPEHEDVLAVTTTYALDVTNDLIIKLTKLLSDSKRFIRVQNGIKVVIFGEPNAGKSTLLNALSNSDKAIVSDIPGTTRDIVESTITIDDITINLFDTAGIRITDDKLENLGINKAWDIAQSADLILILQPVDKLDHIWIERTIKAFSNKKYIVVYTKSDLLQNKPISLFENSVLINAKNHDIQNLIDKIRTIFAVQDILDSDFNVLQSNYQISLLSHSIEMLQHAQSCLGSDPLDLLVDYYSSALEDLNKIIGIDCDYDFLDELFSKFCLGK